MKVRGEGRKGGRERKGGRTIVYREKGRRKFKVRRRGSAWSGEKKGGDVDECKVGKEREKEEEKEEEEERKIKKKEKKICRKREGTKEKKNEKDLDVGRNEGRDLGTE